MPAIPPAVDGPGRRTTGQVRTAILTAARELFNSQGYEGTSTRQIAERAGTTSTTLFRHFGSKAALHERAIRCAEAGSEPEPAAPTRRRYRTEQETRALLIAAATELFSAQGYARASTSQIAERAGIAEIMLFRHFETKANLFRIAIFDPLGALVRRYAEQWNTEDVPGLSHLVSDRFIDEFYKSMIEHRGALMTLFTTRIHEDANAESGADQQAAMTEILGPLERAIRREIDVARYPDVNVTIATRLTIAMIGGTVFFKDWLFPNDPNIDNDQIIHEMKAYIQAAIARH